MTQKLKIAAHTSARIHLVGSPSAVLWSVCQTPALIALQRMNTHVLAHTSTNTLRHANSHVLMWWAAPGASARCITSIQLRAHTQNHLKSIQNSISCACCVAHMQVHAHTGAHVHAHAPGGRFSGSARRQRSLRRSASCSTALVVKSKAEARPPVASHQFNVCSLCARVRVCGAVSAFSGKDKGRGSPPVASHQRLQPVCQREGGFRTGKTHELMQCLSALRATVMGRTNLQGTVMTLMQNRSALRATVMGRTKLLSGSGSAAQTYLCCRLAFHPSSLCILSDLHHQSGSYAFLTFNAFVNQQEAHRAGRLLKHTLSWQGSEANTLNTL